MNSASIVLAVHVIVFAAWFGTDIATFTISRRVVDPSAPPPIRLAMAKLMVSIEVIARLCLPAMLGTGLFVARARGWVDWPGALRWIALGVAACWIGLVWTIHRSGDQGVGSRLARVDLGFRSVVCAGIWLLGVVSLAAGRPMADRWLAGKVVLFAIVMTCGIVIRFALRPFGLAFGGIVASGSTPEREAAVQRSIRRAQPFVGVIWACLLGAALLGVAKP